MRAVLGLQPCPSCMRGAWCIKSETEDVCYIADDGRKSGALSLCVFVFIGGEAAQAGGLGWE